MEREAKVETRILERWAAIMDLLLQLKEKWTAHSEDVHVMNIDYVDPQLQKHIGMAFHRADFYLALPDLVEFAKAQGGIEYLAVRKEKPKDGRRS